MAWRRTMIAEAWPSSSAAKLRLFGHQRTGLPKLALCLLLVAEGLGRRHLRHCRGRSVSRRSAARRSPRQSPRPSDQRKLAALSVGGCAVRLRCSVVEAPERCPGVLRPQDHSGRGSGPTLPRPQPRSMRKGRREAYRSRAWRHRLGRQFRVSRAQSRRPVRRQAYRVGRLRYAPRQRRSLAWPSPEWVEQPERAERGPLAAGDQRGGAIAACDGR